MPISSSPQNLFRILQRFPQHGSYFRLPIDFHHRLLALPLLFTQAIFGKKAENGLNHIGSPCFLYGAWAGFLLAIGCGLVYQWLSIRRVWDDFHTMTWTEEKKGQPGYRMSKPIPHIPKLNLSYFYGGMVVCFFIGVVAFVWFAATTLHSNN